MDELPYKPEYDFLKNPKYVHITDHGRKRARERFDLDADILKQQIGDGKVVFDNGEIIHISCNPLMYAILQRHEKPNHFCIKTVLIQDRKYLYLLRRKRKEAAKMRLLLRS